jgi:hypothetical protein
MSTATNWNVVLSNKNATKKLASFVNGEVGLRTIIKDFSADAKTELYRLEREGVDSARMRIRAALKRRKVSLS